MGRRGGSDPKCGYHWCWLKGRRGGNSSKFDKILIDLKNTTTFSVSKAVKVRAFLHKFPNFSTKISQKKNEKVKKVKCSPIKLNLEGVITIVCIFWKFLQFSLFNYGNFVPRNLWDKLSKIENLRWLIRRNFRWLHLGVLHFFCRNRFHGKFRKTPLENLKTATICQWISPPPLP